jgi:hypothetical protein
LENTEDIIFPLWLASIHHHGQSDTIAALMKQSPLFHIATRFADIVILEIGSLTLIVTSDSI